MEATNPIGAPDQAQRRTRWSAGFTLLELMVVIVILGILAGLVVPQFLDEPHKARAVKARMQMESISTALKKYYIDNGRYPSTEQGLQALTPDYISKIPKDPWGNKYVYIHPGQHGDFDLLSLGADGKEGGKENDKDVGVWETN